MKKILLISLLLGIFLLSGCNDNDNDYVSMKLFCEVEGYTQYEDGLYKYNTWDNEYDYFTCWKYDYLDGNGHLTIQIEAFHHSERSIVNFYNCGECKE